MMLEFFFPMKPLPKQGWKTGRNAKTGKYIAYIDHALKDYQKMISILAKRQIQKQIPGFEPWTGPVEVMCLEYRYRPPERLKSADRVHIENGMSLPKTTRPDVHDNLAKALFDALNGIVYRDDAQVWRMREVKKVFAKEEGIFLQIACKNIDDNNYISSSWGKSYVPPFSGGITAA